MHVGRKFTLIQTLRWTFRRLLMFSLISVIAVLCYDQLNLKWLSIPWMPVSLLGIAVAFTIGFKNNSAYDRLWEARKIWGKIVNDSRAWGVMAIDFTSCGDEEKEILVNRHLAWLTALRFQMRTIKPWEHIDRESRKKREFFDIDEFRNDINDKMKSLLTDDEWNEIKNTANPTAQILKNQSNHLRRLEEEDKLDQFYRIEMSKVIHELYTAQGQSERIKNFPFPRQYASMSIFFVWMFIILLPFGMMPEFEKMGYHFVWLSVPFCVMISWVFHVMERIGDYSENPFEGFVNDIPITTISIGIENDLRQMLNREHSAKKTIVKKDIQF